MARSVRDSGYRWGFAPVLDRWNVLLVSLIAALATASGSTVREGGARPRTECLGRNLSLRSERHASCSEEGSLAAAVPIVDHVRSMSIESCCCRFPQAALTKFLTRPPRSLQSRDPFSRCAWLISPPLVRSRELKKKERISSRA